jgi:D-alanyl-D-alanine carboxypeptidase
VGGRRDARDRVRGAGGCAAIADAAKQTKLDRLHGALKDLTELSEGPPGASALVKRGGKTHFVRAGVGNVDTGEPFHRNDRMRIASTSKAFSGAVALAFPLYYGGLSLDTTIGEVLPQLPDEWSAVTARQLLQHTSGVPSFTKSSAYLAALSADPTAPISHEALLEFVADEPLKFDPGTRYEYSNSDSIMIALMAEAVSGQSYEELLRRLVFEPLDLKRTTMPAGLDIAEPYVRGYDIAPPAPPEDVSKLINADWVWASGALVSTPTDLTKFIRAYASGKLITSDARRAQRSFLPGFGGEPTGPGFNSGGLALYRYELDCGVMLGHTGNFPGYTQFMAATPNGRRSAVVSVNEQLADDTKPEVFEPLKRIFRRASCAALGG